MTTPKRPPKPRLYEYVNDFQDGLSSRGQAFVYLLLLNVDEATPQIPYYVGQADNLATRFHKHDHISWHNMTFARPSMVRVVAQVAHELIYEAEQDLIRRFTLAGYWLSNVQISDALARQEQQVQGIKERSVLDIRRYALTQQRDVEGILENWNQKWATKNIGSRPKLNQTVRRQKRRRITIKDIEKQIQQRKDLNELQKDLLLKIGRNYSFRTRSSTVFLYSSEVAILRSLTKGNRLQGFFTTKKKLKDTAQTYAFELSTSLVGKILNTFNKTNAVAPKTHPTLSVRQLDSAEQTSKEQQMVARKQHMDRELRKPILGSELRNVPLPKSLSNNAIKLHIDLLAAFDPKQQVSVLLRSRILSWNEQEEAAYQFEKSVGELEKLWTTHGKPGSGSKVFFHLTGHVKTVVKKARQELLEQEFREADKPVLD